MGSGLGVGCVFEPFGEGFPWKESDRAGGLVCVERVENGLDGGHHCTDLVSEGASVEAVASECVDGHGMESRVR